MSLIEFQAWLPDSDLSGAPDAVFSTDDQLVDAGFNPVLWGEGDGFLEIHADDPDTQYLQRRGFIRAIRTDTGDGLFWWILEEGSVKLVSMKGPVEKVIRWDGRGMLYYLDRYKLGQAVWAPGQPHRGSVDVIDYWTWVDQPIIAILTRFMEEGQNDTRAEFLNKLDYDFNRVTDSNGNANTPLDEYQVRIGTGGLQIAADAMRLGTVLQVLPESPPLLQAFRALSEYRTDRSSASFAANKVRFQSGQNIATELPHKIVALRERTHTLTRRKDGQYATEALNGSGVPYMEFLEVPHTSDPDAVEAVVGENHLARQKQSTIAVIRHLLGPGGANGADGYFPSPAGGHYWLGDLATVHNGSGEYDLNELPLEVAGIRYFLRGADWMAEAQLGAQVINASGQPVNVPSGGSTVTPGPQLQICRDPIEGGAGEGPSTRWYLSDIDSTSPDLGPSDRAAAWDFDSGPTTGNYHQLRTTPDVAGVRSWDDVSRAAGFVWMTGMVSPALGSGDALSAIQNGAAFRSQVRGQNRQGVGLTLPQENYPALAVRLYRSGTGFVATLFDVTRVNDLKLPTASMTTSNQNRSWDCTLAAFPGALSTDQLVVDYGVDHVLPTDDATGARIDLGGTTTDLPRNETTTTDGYPWVEIAEITSAVSYPGSLPEPTVLPGDESHGECTGVASCCHSHAHGEFGADDDYAGNALHDVISQLGTTETDTAKVLKPDGSGGVLWGTDATGGGGGGGDLLIPTLLQSPAPSGGCDAEFTGTIAPFSAVDGSSGTASLISGSGAGIYDVATRSGWLLMQVGTASGDSVELKQDYTLPDGKCIVAYCSFAVDQAGTASANNEVQLGIAVNDNDAGVASGATGQTLHALVDTEASGAVRVIAFDGTNSLGEMSGSNVVVGGWFLRIDRSGLVYRAFASHDGFSWSYVGAKTMGTAANNVWIYAKCQATMANRIVVGSPWFREGTALAIDPFPLT